MVASATSLSGRISRAAARRRPSRLSSSGGRLQELDMQPTQTLKGREAASSVARWPANLRLSHEVMRDLRAQKSSS